MTLRKKSFENIVGKGENAAWLPAFSPFPIKFSTLPKTNIIILATLILSSANASSLEKPNVFLFGKESLCMYVQNPCLP